MFGKIIRTVLMGVGLAASFAVGFSSGHQTVSPDMIDEINLHGVWLAGENHLTVLTREAVIPLMGTKVDQSNLLMTELHRLEETNDIECSLCQAALGWVEKEVSGNATVTRIEEALDQVCDLATVSSLKSFCIKIIEDYTPELIEYIMARETPQAICQKLGICDAAKSLVRRVKEIRTNELKCTICHYVIEWVEKFIQNERTIAKIEEGLKTVCGEIPTRYQHPCDTLIQTYTEPLIHFILDKESPDVICRQINLCTDAYYTDREGIIPDNFDGRVVFGGCIHPVRDQGKCGSCWAVSASEVLSDRFCISSKRTIDVILSPENLVECDLKDHGCQGGRLDTVWDFMVRHGVVSESCMPYISGTGSSGSCPVQCVDGSNINKVYKAIQARHVWSVTGLVETIQVELMNGPVQAAFEVYQDFVAYRSGVYRHVTGSLLGGHAIEIVGWGVETSQPFWLVKNSWGVSWGMSGYFKILRGGNECGIESNVYTGSPQLKTSSTDCCLDGDCCHGVEWCCDTCDGSCRCSVNGRC